jgi:hypothetical protein
MNEDSAVVNNKWEKDNAKKCARDSLLSPYFGDPTDDKWNDGLDKRKEIMTSY